MKTPDVEVLSHPSDIFRKTLVHISKTFLKEEKLFIFFSAENGLVEFFALKGYKYLSWKEPNDGL